jgi:uncharacterized membrane protein
MELAAMQTPWWRRPPAIVATSLAATGLLWVLSVLMGRAEGWQPPAGARIALFVHLATALPAVPLGALVLWRTKGDRLHRLQGRIWAGLMVITALSTFWLQSLSGGFSFIHLFSVLTLVSIPLGIVQARRGNVRAHLGTMRGVYFGLIAAGLLAAAPGRYLGGFVFG